MLYLQLCSLVFVIGKFPPLVESVQLKLSALWSVLREERGLGPLVSEVLISGDRVVLLLSRGSAFRACFGCEAGLVVWLQRFRGLGTPLETSLEIGILVDLRIRSGPWIRCGVCYQPLRWPEDSSASTMWVELTHLLRTVRPVVCIHLCGLRPDQRLLTPCTLVL